MIRMMILVGVLLAACSPQRYVARQLAKHPEWGTDTTVVLVPDTLMVRKYVHDTTFMLNLHDSTDTLRIENDTVRLVITRWREKLKVQTVVKDRPVPFVKEKVVIRHTVVKAGTLNGLNGVARLVLLMLIMTAFVLGVWSGYKMNN